MLNLLLGDIGGTNVRLELCKYKIPTDHKDIHKKVYYKTSDYETFDQVLHAFLTDVEMQDYPTQACIAICGPVLNNRVNKMSNTTWKDIDGQKLGPKFSIPDFYLINDFHAVGLAHRTFNDLNLVQLNPNADMTQGGTKMFIGFGTGIGVCCINEYVDYSGGIRTKILTSEASSIPIGIKNKFDFTYQQFIKRQYELPVNRVPAIELLIGAKSLPYMYDFFKIIHDNKQGFNYETKNSLQLDVELFKVRISTTSLPGSKDIIEQFKNNDTIAISTIKYFLELLGNALFVFCVPYLPTGGIILMGPILHELFNSFGEEKEYYTNLLIHNYLLDSFLRERFSTAKIYLYTHKHEPGIKGALAYLKKKDGKLKLIRHQTL